MGKVILLLLLAAACAAPEAPHVFRLDAIDPGAIRAANDPVREEARRVVDRAAIDSTPIRASVFTDMIIDGCPEGWVGLFYVMPVWGRERAQMQCELLGLLADIDPDHAWFARHIARTWIYAEAAIDHGHSLPEMLHAKAEYLGSPLARLAGEARRADVRAAAAGVLGVMLIRGNLPNEQGADEVARGARFLREALATWNSKVVTPSELALEHPRTPARARAELERLVVAAAARGGGRHLVPIQVLDQDGTRVGIEDALADRPGVVVVWGFT